MGETPLPRSQFPVTERCIYLNHAGIGPLPIVAADAIAESATAFCEEGGLAFDRYAEIMERTREAGARLMGVPVADVAFVKNTTEGIAFAAGGIDWQPSDRVILPNYEFPSNAYPWLALRDRGVQVDLIEPLGPRRELPIELFEHALQKARTRVVAVSWVQFGYGWRTDLAALGTLCREHDALLCVDAIQGLGVMPARFDEWHVDVAAADAHKWLLGPHGIGLLSVSPRAREQLRPLEPGGESMADREDFDNLNLDFDDTARRYEGGSPNLITIAGMAESIDLLERADIEHAWTHVDDLCRRLSAGLAELGAELRSVHDTDNRSAIVSFVLPDRDNAAVADALDRRNVVHRVRAGAVRFSPHAYNTVDEIEATLDVVRTLR